MGKSLYAKRLGEELAQYGLGSVSSNVAIIPLQGPIVNNDILLQLLERYKNNSTTCIYHIDISSSVRINSYNNSKKIMTRNMFCNMKCYSYVK